METEETPNGTIWKTTSRRCRFDFCSSNPKMEPPGQRTTLLMGFLLNPGAIGHVVVRFLGYHPKKPRYKPCNRPRRTRATSLEWATIWTARQIELISIPWIHHPMAPGSHDFNFIVDLL